MINSTHKPLENQNPQQTYRSHRDQPPIPQDFTRHAADCVITLTPSQTLLLSIRIESWTSPTEGVSLKHGWLLDSSISSEIPAVISSKSTSHATASPLNAVKVLSSSPVEPSGFPGRPLSVFCLDSKHSSYSNNLQTVLRMSKMKHPTILPILSHYKISNTHYVLTPPLIPMTHSSLSSALDSHGHLFLAYCILLAASFCVKSSFPLPSQLSDKCIFLTCGNVHSPSRFVYLPFGAHQDETSETAGSSSTRDPQKQSQDKGPTKDTSHTLPSKGPVQAFVTYLALLLTSAPKIPLIRKFLHYLDSILSSETTTSTFDTILQHSAFTISSSPINLLINCDPVLSLNKIPNHSSLTPHFETVISEWPEQSKFLLYERIFRPSNIAHSKVFEALISALFKHTTTFSPSSPSDSQQNTQSTNSLNSLLKFWKSGSSPIFEEFDNLCSQDSTSGSGSGSDNVPNDMMGNLMSIIQSFLIKSQASDSSTTTTIPKDQISLLLSFMNPFYFRLSSSSLHIPTSSSISKPTRLPNYALTPLKNFAFSILPGLEALISLEHDPRDIGSIYIQSDRLLQAPTSLALIHFLSYIKDHDFLADPQSGILPHLFSGLLDSDPIIPYISLFSLVFLTAHLWDLKIHQNTSTGPTNTNMDGTNLSPITPKKRIRSTPGNRETNQLPVTDVLESTDASDTTTLGATSNSGTNSETSWLSSISSFLVKGKDTLADFVEPVVDTYSNFRYALDHFSQFEFPNSTAADHWAQLLTGGSAMNFDHSWVSWISKCKSNFPISSSSDTTLVDIFSVLSDCISRTEDYKFRAWCIFVLSSLLPFLSFNHIFKSLLSIILTGLTDTSHFVVETSLLSITNAIQLIFSVNQKTSPITPHQLVLLAPQNWIPSSVIPAISRHLFNKSLNIRRIAKKSLDSINQSIQNIMSQMETGNTINSILQQTVPRLFLTPIRSPYLKQLVFKNILVGDSPLELLHASSQNIGQGFSLESLTHLSSTSHNDTSNTSGSTLNNNGFTSTSSHHVPKSDKDSEHLDNLDLEISDLETFQEDSKTPIPISEIDYHNMMESSREVAVQDTSDTSIHAFFNSSKTQNQPGNDTFGAQGVPSPVSVSVSVPEPEPEPEPSEKFKAVVPPGSRKAIFPNILSPSQAAAKRAEKEAIKRTQEKKKKKKQTKMTVKIDQDVQDDTPLDSDLKSNSEINPFDYSNEDDDTLSSFFNSKDDFDDSDTDYAIEDTETETNDNPTTTATTATTSDTQDVHAVISNDFDFTPKVPNALLDESTPKIPLEGTTTTTTTTNTTLGDLANGHVSPTIESHQTLETTTDIQPEASLSDFDELSDDDTTENISTFTKPVETQSIFDIDVNVNLGVSNNAPDDFLDIDSDTVEFGSLVSKPEPISSSDSNSTTTEKPLKLVSPVSPTLNLNSSIPKNKVVSAPTSSRSPLKKPAVTKSADIDPLTRAFTFDDNMFSAFGVDTQLSTPTVTTNKDPNIHEKPADTPSTADFVVDISDDDDEDFDF